MPRVLRCRGWLLWSLYCWRLRVVNPVDHVIRALDCRLDTRVLPEPQLHISLQDPGLDREASLTIMRILEVEAISVLHEAHRVFIDGLAEDTCCVSVWEDFAGLGLVLVHP